MHSAPPYPDDADGDALQRIAADGSDMSRPMVVDFMVAAPSEHVARDIERVVGALGYATELQRSDNDEAWTVYCTRTMVLDHASVLAAQAELDRVSKPLGACCDGWGTAGNAETE